MKFSLLKNYEKGDTYMITKNDFIRIMNTQKEMALATSMDDCPNVRIVNFYFDATANTLFFTTFGDNEKIKEFESNSKIAFTTIPHEGTEHVKGKAYVEKSSISVFDIADKFISKIPDYKDTIEQAGMYLVLFQIKVDTALVILDFDNIDTINLI